MIHARDLISPLRRVKGVYYGWWLAGLTGLVMTVVGVPMFHSISVWNPVLRGHFGWTPGQMSVALAFMRMQGGLMGPMEGLLVERLGSRRMVLIGMLLAGCGFLMFSRIGELWHFYAVYALMALGNGLGTYLPMMTALNNWFIRRRAVAMGWGLVGSSIGAVLFVPALAWAIDPDHPDRWGWRAMAAGIGMIIILLALPISRLVRDRPEDYGQRPYGYTPDLATATDHQAGAPLSPTVERDPTWREAIQTRPFWFMSLGYACVNAVHVTMMVHMGFVLDDRGFSLQEVGLILATYTAVGAVSLVVSGYIGDRMPIRPTIFVFGTLQSLPLLILLVADNVPVAFLFAVLIGIGFGGRNTLILAARGLYFGRRGFASITGMSTVSLQVVGLVASVFAGYMFDYTGTYNVPFVTIALVGFMGSVLFLLMGQPPSRFSGRTVGPGHGETES